VHYVLEGSVRRDAGRVRISAQLIQLRDQTHVWARQYDRELGDLLALQGEIAREITGEILPVFGDPKPSEGGRRTTSPPKTYAAYDLYLKARYFWNKRTGEGFQQAVAQFQQAIDSDPTYPRSWAGLADSYALMNSYSLAPAKELMPKARAAALRALQLDERLAEAHTSLALISLTYEWDWQAAEKGYRRAIQLDPNYATAHHWYAELLAFQGRFDEALAESERARRLDPLSLIIATDRGVILYFARQYDRAIEQLRAVLDMDPNFAHGYIIMNAYVEKGMFEEALAEVRKYRSLDSSPWSWAQEAYVYGRWGRQARAREALTRFERANRTRRLNPTSVLPFVYAAMNEKATAIALLQKASEERSHILTVLKVEPNYDPLRSDPRFQALLQRVGLAR
jgi:tetratricopeptide (TPR) repeat protein